MERYYRWGIYVDRGADWDEGGNELAPLYHAIVNGQPAAVKWLLDHGENPNHAFFESGFALDYAEDEVRRGGPNAPGAAECVEILKAYGAQSGIPPELRRR